MNESLAFAKLLASAMKDQPKEFFESKFYPQRFNILTGSFTDVSSVRKS